MAASEVVEEGGGMIFRANMMEKSEMASARSQKEVFVILMV